MEYKHLFDRSKMLLGEDGINRLKNSKVVVLGLGGVGGAACETLARTGVGTLVIVDMDVISESNINRQIIATTKNIGQLKTQAMKERILDINPNCNVIIHNTFILEDNIKEIIDNEVTYVLDCIDTVTAKLNVAQYCYENNINIISSMGAGNKLDPTKLQFKDIFQTKICPLAKVMRRELKNRGVSKLKVLYSEEEALTPIELMDKENPTLIKAKRKTPGSVAFVPPVAGIMLAGFVIREICEK